VQTRASAPQALNAGAPAASYVVTPDWLKNWAAPMCLPTRLIDRAICARFGLLKCAPSTDTSELLRKTGSSGPCLLWPTLAEALAEAQLPSSRA
jgi:hypothetical protein